MTAISEQAVAKFVEGIRAPEEARRTHARSYLDTLTKPLGSLGRLEDLAAQIAAIRPEFPTLPLSKAVYVFAADHGVTAEGVSAYPSAVTQQMVFNFLNGGAAVSVLSRAHDVELHVVDVGVDADFADDTGLLHRKVCRGTRNMLHVRAMTDEQLARALEVGAELAEDAAVAGHTLLAVGEMGIGNTTSASAITSALTGSPAALATGRGTGLDAEAHRRKIAMVGAILQKHFLVKGSPSPLRILSCVGGLEIAAITGMVLVAARHRIAIVIDGFISTAAAALAVALCPDVRGYLIAGHRSEEPGHQLLLDYLGLTPVLTLEMRLGEGSGAVLAMPIIESAIALYSQMATFASAGVNEASA
ncbi:Nicotinate-nucleotide--dimethylbenzimidazole phosphoribosyltransferase [Acidisarcina polymorpha]|uniref:Nicotinate-nucleotide--dimethylbenzimidazole phosphoribosyltransferase n=1 Tax=Acidisarcina polymorpha TaxID=2211140 RepID=A0A2Z5G772_9BACT|nr:nicotinate-nucleotide--dimethylbenzimidazole phosphoribosyltransferase [Acidisarcina polymorpha]AXC14406.1 Nicotinate-nucleotide--dimethylbenzimidazole phosphoribosyltransferase [Acidisarcina polymorpha]